MSAPKAKPYISAIAPYVGGKSKAEGAARVVKLSSNENPYGPSPKALEAYRDTSALLHRYPEDGSASLREAIGHLHGFDPAQIICGVGSDEVLGMLVHAYAGVGDEVMFCEHGFLMYRVYSGQYGATPVSVKERDLRTDVDALLAAVTDKTRLLFIANPNNPTGSYIPQTEVARLRAGLRDDIILVLDGAYAEYMTAPDYSDGRELVSTTNTIITRTFSKVYGLPALRVGWGYGHPDIISTLYKVRDPFNISQPAIAAAIAALQDTGYIAQQVALNNEQRDRVSLAVQALGIHVLPSVTNFILLQFDSPEQASHVNTALMQQGIIIREVANYGLPDCLRMTIGTAEENDLFLAALSACVAV